MITTLYVADKATDFITNTVGGWLKAIGLALVVIALLAVGIKIIFSGLGSGESGGLRKAVGQLGMIGLGAIIIASAGGISLLLGSTVFA